MIGVSDIVCAYSSFFFIAGPNPPENLGAIVNDIKTGKVFKH